MSAHVQREHFHAASLAARGFLGLLFATGSALVALAQNVAPPPVPGAGPALPPPAAGAPIHPGDEGQPLDEGPVHEAFADPVVLDARPSPVVARRPPDPINELAPEVRPDGNNVEWIAGYWMWSDPQNDFVWVSGVWRDIPPGRRWTPGYWTEVDGGWQWIAGFWGPTVQAEARFLPPPPDNLDMGPNSPAPGGDYFWIPGVWVWGANSYAWRPGYWYLGQADWLWTPDHYCYTPRGYVFIGGFWDRPLFRRGLLYAPVWWGSGWRPNPGFAYRPWRAINSNLLLSALFIGGGRNSYYFGHSPWMRANMQPWYNFPRHRGVYDPISSYHRWHDGRNQPNWLGDVQTQFARKQRQFHTGAAAGSIARQPGGALPPGTGRRESAHLVANADQLLQASTAGQSMLKLRRSTQLELASAENQIRHGRQAAMARVQSEAHGDAVALDRVGGQFGARPGAGRAPAQNGAPLHGPGANIATSGAGATPATDGVRQEFSRRGGPGAPAISGQVNDAVTGAPRAGRWGNQPGAGGSEQFPRENFRAKPAIQNDGAILQNGWPLRGQTRQLPSGQLQNGQLPNGQLPNGQPAQGVTPGVQGPPNSGNLGRQNRTDGNWRIPAGGPGASNQLPPNSGGGQPRMIPGQQFPRPQVGPGVGGGNPTFRSSAGAPQFRGGAPRQFQGAPFQGGQIQGRQFQGPQPQGGQFQGGQFQGRQLQSGQFQGRQLQSGQFQGRQPQGGQFQGRQLQGGPAPGGGGGQFRGGGRGGGNRGD